MNRDDERLKMLLRDLGEIDEKFIDEADTQIAQTEVKRKRISWYIPGAVAAAACVAVMVGLNLPDRNESVPGTQPELPEFSESSFTDETVSETDSEPETAEENSQTTVSEETDITETEHENETEKVSDGISAGNLDFQTVGTGEVIYLDSDDFRGEIRSHDGNQVYGYTDSYVFANSQESVSRNWDVEETWHVTAARAVSCENGIFFDCYDTDDNDHYGWINRDDIYFYSYGN